MEKEYYTELRYRHKMYDEEQPTEVTIKIPKWDTNGEDMFDVFYKIWCSAGFIPDGFTTQCQEWIDENNFKSTDNNI